MKRRLVVSILSLVTVGMMLAMSLTGIAGASGDVIDDGDMGIVVRTSHRYPYYFYYQYSMGFDGKTFVNARYDIWTYDIASDKVTRFTAPGYARYCDVSGDYVAYSEYTTSPTYRGVWYMDITNGARTRIRDTPGNYIFGVRMDGDRIVWGEYRSGNYDIYMYDISDRRETRVTTNSGVQYFPDIDGDLIVYQDNRHLHLCVYVYDLSTGQETLVSNYDRCYNPVIEGDRVIYEYRYANSTGHERALYEYDVSNGVTTHLYHSPYSGDLRPSIHSGKIVWMDSRAHNNDIYMYDYNNGLIKTLTTNESSQIYPFVYDDIVTWIDYRWGSTWLTYLQLDQDSDGVLDSQDAFPYTSTEWKDTDGDGVGDNRDTDDDGDGVPDVRDPFPTNKNEWMDTDGDGVGDNSDGDDDNDGVADGQDAFPKNPREFLDKDRDGIGDWLDPDDDNDGTPDEVEWQSSVNQRFGNLDNALSLTLTTLQDDLDDAKAEIQDTLGDLGTAMQGMETNLMGTLADVNSSLATDIQDGVDAIITDMMGVNASLAAQMMASRDDILSDANAMEAWLDAVLAALDDEMRAANSTLHGSIGDLSDDLDDYYTTLDSDLMEAMRLIMTSEANLTEGMAEDVEELSQLMQDLSAETLDDLSAKLRDIAGNLSELDEETAASLTALAEDIDDFSTTTKSDTDEIDSTLEDLAKLDSIISDVEQVGSDLSTAREEIEDEVQTTHDEQMGRSTVNMALIAVVFILVIIVLLLMFQNRRMAAEAPSLEEERDEEIVVLEDL